MQIVNAKIVKVGKSRRIRIPKSLLKEAGFKKKVVIESRFGEIIIRAGRHPREGWAEQALEMAKNGDDVLLDPYVPTKFDLEEWQW